MRWIGIARRFLWQVCTVIFSHGYFKIWTRWKIYLKDLQSHFSSMSLVSFLLVQTIRDIQAGLERYVVLCPSFIDREACLEVASGSSEREQLTPGFYFLSVPLWIGLRFFVRIGGSSKSMMLPFFLSLCERNVHLSLFVTPSTKGIFAHFTHN